MFSDSLSLTKDHDKRVEEKNQPMKERTIESPSLDDMGNFSRRRKGRLKYQ